MSEVNRISASKIKVGVDTGTTLLICAYNSDEKFDSFHLDGAIPLSEFKVRLPDLAKDKQLVFYCA